jgi:hypothetical protein
MKIRALWRFVKDKQNVPRKFTDFFVDEMSPLTMFYIKDAAPGVV